MYFHFDVAFLLRSNVGAVAQTTQPQLEVIGRENFTDSSVSIPSEVIPNLTEFTACVWLKLKSEQAQVRFDK